MNVAGRRSSVRVHTVTSRAMRDGRAGCMSGRTAVDMTGDAVELVAAGVVSVASTMTARESKERHGSHAGGTENHAEYVEVHLSTHGSQEIFTPAIC
jgi:hypothetical protein